MCEDYVEVRESKGKGLGVFAKCALAENTWIGDYTGAVLTQDEYIARYPNEDGEYVLGANSDYNVDAADPRSSSFLRYLNHSATCCNLFFDVAKVRRQRHKEIKFYTARHIAVGEELLFDYGPTYWRGRNVPPIE